MSEYPDLDWPCWEMDEEPIIMTDEWAKSSSGQEIAKEDT